MELKDVPDDSLHCTRRLIQSHEFPNKSIKSEEKQGNTGTYLSSEKKEVNIKLPG